MYGALLVEKDMEQADMAVLFMHNEGRNTDHLHWYYSYSEVRKWAIPVNKGTPPRRSKC